jgi:hypothetical protein
LEGVRDISGGLESSWYLRHWGRLLRLILRRKSSVLWLEALRLLLLGLLGRGAGEASELRLELSCGETGGLRLYLRVTERRGLAGESGRLGSKTSRLRGKSSRLRLLH